MITKSEVYESLIKIQKESGQGLSGIVKAADRTQLYSKYLDELIKEGLVIACHTGGSLGHYESNVFYMPTSGYNVWLDEGTDGKHFQHKGRYLQFVRLYLGLIKMESNSPIDPGLLTYLQNPDIMKEYTEWLSRNHEQLQIMVNLDTVYPGENSGFRSSADIEWIKSDIEWIKNKDWYKENKTISECLNKSKKVIEEDKKILSITEELISLYKTNKVKYGDKLREESNSLQNLKRELEIRNRVNEWLESQDQSQKVQSLIQN